MILVTGGTGFVGSHLLENLRARGETVRVLLRRRSNPRYLPAEIETAVADLASGSGLDAALEGVDTVIHVAGATRAFSATEYFVANAETTATIARAATARSSRLVYISSIAAAGPSMDGKPLIEDVEPHPVTAYGRSKLEGERQARKLAPDCVIVRPPVVYGPRDTGVFQILKAISRGLALEIGGGERWFSAIYVEDLAEGIALAARAPQAAGRTYFLTYPKPSTWREFGDSAAQIMRRHPRRFRVPLRAAQTVGFFAEIWSHITRNPAIISREKVAEACCRFWTCDPARFATDLGFEAPTPLVTGLAKTLAWYKETGWICY